MENKINLEDTWGGSPDCDKCLRVYSNTSDNCKKCISDFNKK